MPVDLDIGSSVLLGSALAGLFGIYDKDTAKLRNANEFKVSKCSWTHACLSRMKKGIVTPWNRQDIAGWRNGISSVS